MFFFTPNFLCHTVHLRYKSNTSKNTTEPQFNVKTSTQELHSSIEKMSHQSSSVGQFAARQGQLLQLDPGPQTCILVCFFWGYNPHWPLQVQSRFATCVKDYIGERFDFWLQSEDILRYYNSIPAAVKKAGLSHEWNEEMLGLCIAELIQNSEEFDVMTDLSGVSGNSSS